MAAQRWNSEMRTVLEKHYSNSVEACREAFRYERKLVEVKNLGDLPEHRSTSS